MTDSPAPSFPPAATLADLAEVVARLAAAADRPDEALARRVAAVSAWSVAEQLGHLATANRLCLAQIALLLRGRAEAASPPLHPMGLAALESGTIPRGRVTAPGMTVPEAPLDGAALRAAFADHARRAAALAADPAALAAAAGVRPHPIIGGMTALQWTRFTVVHSRHHLAIVDEIDRAATAA